MLLALLIAETWYKVPSQLPALEECGAHASEDNCLCPFDQLYIAVVDVTLSFLVVSTVVLPIYFNLGHTFFNLGAIV